MPSASFAIRKMQIKIALRSHLTPAERLRPRKQSTAKASEAVGKRPPFFVDRTANWCSRSGNQCGEFSKSQSQIYPMPARPLPWYEPRKTNATRCFTYGCLLQCSDMRMSSEVPAETRKVGRWGRGEAALERGIVGPRYHGGGWAKQAVAAYGELA